MLDFGYISGIYCNIKTFILMLNLNNLDARKTLHLLLISAQNNQINWILEATQVKIKTKQLVVHLQTGILVYLNFSKHKAPMQVSKMPSTSET